MGGGGGGSAGKVEYPAYLTTLHRAFLTNTETDEPSFSAVDILNDAMASSPFDSLLVYNGRGDIGTNPYNVGQALSEILTFDTNALTLFSSQFTPVAQSVQDLFSLNSIQEALLQDSNKAEEERQHLLRQYYGQQVELGTTYSSAFTLGQVAILDTKMRAVMAAGSDQISKGILQLGQNKLANTLNLIEIQWANFKISKTAYALSVEMCKLSILNEREYFEQAEYYAKYGAHWKFERMQSFANMLAAMPMGKKMTWVSSPDLPGWAIDAAVIGGYLAGDPIGANQFKHSKKFRTVAGGAAMGAAQGALTGASFGGIGAVPGLIIGGVLGGVMSYVNYKEGDWR